MPTPFRWNGTDAQGQTLRWNAPGVTWNGAAANPPPSNNSPPAKTMPQLHVLLDFVKAPDHGVEDRAGAVIASLYADPDAEALRNAYNGLVLALRRL